MVNKLFVGSDARGLSTLMTYKCLLAVCIAAVLRKAGELTYFENLAFSSEYQRIK